MEILLSLARLSLAGVFVVAGVAKLMDLAGAERSLRAFGAPALLSRPLAVGLPVLELVLAIALLFAGVAQAAAVGLLLVLGVFSAGLIVALLRGKRPPCHCFGQLSDAPIGMGTLARNLGLAALAAFVAWPRPDGPGPSLVAWLMDLRTAEAVGLALGLVLLGVCLTLAWFLVQALGQTGRLLLRVEALEAAQSATTGRSPINGWWPGGSDGSLPTADPAPSFSLPDLQGDTVSLDDLVGLGRPVMLVFSAPECGACDALMPHVARWEREHQEDLTIAVIGRGALDANRRKAAEHGLGQVLLQQGDEAAQAYRIQATPSAVLVWPDGTVGGSPALGADAIRQLVHRIVGDGDLVPLPVVPTHGQPHHHEHGHGHGSHTRTGPNPAPRLEIGQPLPPIVLQDLDGRAVALDQPRAGGTVILLWDPGCGYCRQMVPDLLDREADPPTDGPALLVVARGTADDNRATGLASPVVLDPTFATGRALGARGTPSAILVDEDGRIASALVEGVPAVLDLILAGHPSPVA